MDNGLDKASGTALAQDWASAAVETAGVSEEMTGEEAAALPGENAAAAEDEGGAPLPENGSEAAVTYGGDSDAQTEECATGAGGTEGDGADSRGAAGFLAERAALIQRAESYARRAVEGEARAAAALLGVPEERIGVVLKLADLSGIDPADGEARAKVGRAVRVALAEVPELGGAGTGSVTQVPRKRRDAFARGFLGE